MISLRDNDVLSLFVPESDYVDSALLLAGVEQTRTVPAEARLVIFESSGNFFYKNGAAATVPGDLADGSASEQNPRQRNVQPGDVLHLISEDTSSRITLAYYK